MKLSSLASNARPIAIVSALALFVVLFLDWREVSVTTPAVSVDAGTSAWAGWGAVAGVLLVAYLVAELRFGPSQVVPVLALLAAGFTVVEFFTGTASTDVAGVVSVDTGAELWPAYVGVALAIVLAAASAVRLFGATRRLAPPPTRVGTPGHA